MAAEQGNVQSMVDIGDAYYYGRGVVSDMAKALSVYNHASQHKSAQATFNLGYMHEQGLGVEKDVHLAKRFYDRASSMHRDAAFPVSLVLLKLQVDKWLEERGYSEVVSSVVDFVKRQNWVVSVLEYIMDKASILSEELFMVLLSLPVIRLFVALCLALP